MKSNGLPNRERRLSERIDHQTTIMHETGDNGIFHVAQLMNYSNDGCYFETRVNHRPGDIVYIDFEESPYAGGSAMTEGHQAKVVWCKKIERVNGCGWYGVGVKYRESFN